MGQHRVASIGLESSREDRIAGRAENQPAKKEGRRECKDRAASEGELPG